jgi:AcrR family transcriptional regulator
MTEKKEKILQSALELFANEGYKSTSTSRIAKHAEVSEGLIFRHFGNKEGLLEAILLEGEERAKMVFADIVLETDPRKVIEKTLQIGRKMLSTEEDREFWKLQFKIKWETEQYGEHKMEPLQLALTNAFEKLGYPSPQLEAKMLLANMDGLAMHYFLKKEFNLEEMVAHMRNLYDI